MTTLEIEWRHLDKDGRTCLRCSDTLQSLQQVVAQLAAECAPRGVTVAYRETKLPLEQLSESNLILFNDIPLEAVLPDASASASECQSCGDLCGEPSVCRTVSVGGHTFEAIPAALIRQAACAVARCC
ncbi:MAG: DUF2703 domain-containing protein [Candidatus Competibacteraceae bacterium]|nr:DUF2703 domain-containing protein [Candidatus Competibacteraceae bacterium]MCB1768826.1 DUF2703 domain-containing protein [Candidatus Competibacteraceae bacterium]MCB1822198.1 DUF2703 domain-containing protein [Candidatus Competibacteraceae bacterium]MCP5126249.1 DUF2703 domain-containing protein [Gammaproteobacteria bacterium]